MKLRKTRQRKFQNIIRQTLILIVALLFTVVANGQFADTTMYELKKTHNKSPQKALLYSAIFPGMGQIYNKQYIKAPVVYGLIGIFGYLIIDNNTKYQNYRQEYYRLQAYKTSNPEDASLSNFEPRTRYGISEGQLEQAKDYYHRQRDMNAVYTTLVYVANLLDAYVSAHFLDFDISEDLSMNISPGLPNHLLLTQQLPLQSPTYGITVRLAF